MNVSHTMRITTIARSCRCGRGSRSGCLWFMTLVIGTIFEDIEVAIQLLIKLTNTCQVLEPVAIVWRRPYSRQLAIKQLLVAFLADLMSSVDPNTTIGLKESFNYISSKHVTCATI